MTSKNQTKLIIPIIVAVVMAVLGVVSTIWSGATRIQRIESSVKFGQETDKMLYEKFNRIDDKLDGIQDLLRDCNCR